MITGDFNIHANASNDPSAPQLIDLLENVGLQQHVSVPSHGSGHTLDLIITRNSRDLVVDSAQVTNYDTDHSFVQCHLSRKKPTLERKTIIFRQLRKIDLNNFESDLRLSHLGSGKLQNTDERNLDDFVKLYHENLTTCLDKHAPLKTKPVEVRPKLPWFDSSLQEAKRAGRNAEERWWRSKSDEDRAFFKLKRNKFIHRLNMAKQQYYSDKIIECQGDERKLFELLKSLFEAKEKIQYPASASKQKLANDFNDYFVAKIKATRDELHAIDIEKTPFEYLKDYKAARKFFHCELLSENQIREIIKKSPNKQCVSDPVPTWLLKELLDIILPFITGMVNLSLQTGYSDDAWKEALIGPLLKGSGLEIIFQNFRPVSNLSFISQLVERVTVNQTLSNINLNCPLPVCQSTYREHQKLL